MPKGRFWGAISRLRTHSAAFPYLWLIFHHSETMVKSGCRQPCQVISRRMLIGSQSNGARRPLYFPRETELALILKYEKVWYTTIKN